MCLAEKSARKSGCRWAAPQGVFPAGRRGGMARRGYAVTMAPALDRGDDDSAAPHARTPAERYAEFRDRQAHPELASFRALYGFEFDDFQIRACTALNAGHGVLVAAPTGSGKTVVGEFAVHLALERGLKCFYTTPIKALSNQKYADLVRRYDSRTVGLLTGDNSVNGEAPIVVMTTEVLRNMLYAGSATLNGLGYVVLDEVHYLADRSRGAVWEEVIIHLPESVRVVALSATVSNAEEFGDWLDDLRGGVTVIVDEHRPVPLWQHMMAGSRLYDLFTDPAGTRVNPELMRMAQRDRWAQTQVATTGRSRPARGGRRGHPGGRPGRSGGGPPASRPGRARPPYRPEVVSRLDGAGLLPAIEFIFSRAGCDAAVQQCLAAGLRLTQPDEVATITEFVERRTADLPDEDLAVLGYGEWLTGLQRGIAAHHAGMLPTFKEVVEELFSAGLVRVVFATETLALGINMPARTVVIEKLDKWNGETHAELTPGEYTQLTGRAGRRGIDVEGHAVVLWQPGIDPDAVGGLAGTRTYPLNSSFRPSYNMAVNLTGQVGRDRAAALLESSFAQFQADRGVLDLTRQVRRNRAAMADLARKMACDRGDFAEYAALRRELSDQEGDLSRRRAVARRTEAARSLEVLRRGDIIRVPGGRRSGMAVVLEPGPGPHRAPDRDGRGDRDGRDRRGGRGDRDGRGGRRAGPRAARPGRPQPRAARAAASPVRRRGWRPWPGTGHSCSPPTARSSGCHWPISRCRSKPSTGSGFPRRSASGPRSTAGISPPPCATGSPTATSAARSAPPTGTTTARRNGRPATSDPGHAMRPGPRCVRASRRARAGDRRAAAPAAPAPQPWLPGPGGTRPLRRAVHAAESGDRGPGTQGGQPLARHRAHLRPGLRGAGKPRLPHRGHGHPRGAAARWPVHRTGPARGRMPAPRLLGRPRHPGAHGVRLGAVLRIPPER